MTLEELKRQISTGELKIDCSNKTIITGKLLHKSGNQADYAIKHGWDIVTAKIIKCV